MNILFMEMQHQNLPLMKKLVEDGNTVYTTQHMDNREYLEYFGIKPVDKFPYLQWDGGEVNRYSEMVGLPIVQEIIEELKLDLIWCSAPSQAHLLDKYLDDFPIINTTEQSRMLETKKLFARTFAEGCGIKAPKILAQGDNHIDLDASELPTPFVVKPKSIWHSSCIVHDTGMWEQRKENYLQVPMEYYVEELVKGQETNISYIMSDGKWAFTFSESCDESLAKRIEYNNPLAWFRNTTVEQMTPELDKRVRDNVVGYLNEAAKLGGTYEGSITQMLGEDNELYFLENNVRPYTHNSFPIPFGGNEYLDAFRNNPQKIGDWFEGRHFPKLTMQSLTIENPLSTTIIQYPFHLHEKYGVHVPTGLQYINGEFILDSGAVILVFEDEINMDFVEEMKKETNLIPYFGE